MRAPGDGTVVIQTRARRDVGLSGSSLPFQWQFGAAAVQPRDQPDARRRAVRGRCETDPDFGHEFTRRMIVVVARRLQATRMQLLDEFTGRETRGR
jgi:hypothetical protein